MQGKHGNCKLKKDDEVKDEGGKPKNSLIYMGGSALIVYTFVFKHISLSRAYLTYVVQVLKCEAITQYRQLAKVLL